MKPLKIAIVTEGFCTDTAAGLWESLPKQNTQAEVWVYGGSEQEKAGFLLPQPIAKEAIWSGEVTQSVDSALAWCSSLQKKREIDGIIMQDSHFSRQLAIRLGIQLGWQKAVNIIEFRQEKGQIIAVRKACASNIHWKIPFVNSFVGTLQKRAKQASMDFSKPEILLKKAPQITLPWLLESTPLVAKEKNILLDAPLVFVGGKGLANKENCDLLRHAAKKHGAAAGFTRPVALNGWCEMHEIIGQSGLQISPEKCVVFAASGASAFVVGIEGAAKVIAINSDENAPLFRNADVGLVADAVEILQQLAE